jgi:hypothetical protein
MSTYTFGQELTVNFYPKDSEGNALTPSAEDPSILLYADRPSRSDVASQSGGDEITTWSTSGNARVITVPAVEDPDPNGASNVQDYWLGIRFSLEATKQEQVVILPICIERPFGYGVELNIAASDLEKYFPQIDKYASEAQQTAFAGEAVEEIKAALKSGGFEWAKVRRPDRLRLAAIALILANVALSQIADGDLGFQTLLDESKEKASRLLSETAIEYDSSGDGEADVKVKRRPYKRVVV